MVLLVLYLVIRKRKAIIGGSGIIIECLVFVFFGLVWELEILVFFFGFGFCIVK